MPKLNETQMVIGPRGGRKQIMIWLACPQCGKERWVQFRHTRKASYTALCALCNTKQPRLQTYLRGSEHPMWKGGRIYNEGYILKKLSLGDFFYPMANKHGYVREHRLVMAKHLGRNLHSWEIVHHKGVRFKGIENRSDNLIDNLQLVTDDRHTQITILEKRISYLEAENKKLKSLLNRPRSSRQ